ncbi:hypothetical protein LZK73_33340 (plasmid) [Neorhizobium galegae]|nr:hypothetical protein LZK73_33340 [Neorhizobium galegae]
MAAASLELRVQPPEAAEHRKDGIGHQDFDQRNRGTKAVVGEPDDPARQ